MERASGTASRPPDRQLVPEEWEEYSPGLIVATIEWEHARIVLNWAVDDEQPVRARTSPDHVVDLVDLWQAAAASERPREYFDSHAACALHLAQWSLVDFFRDGPTDDIPYERHLIFVRGVEFTDRTVGVSDLVFTWERHDR